MDVTISNPKEPIESLKCPSVQSPASLTESLPASLSCQGSLQWKTQDDPVSLELPPPSTTSTVSTSLPKTIPITSQYLPETVARKSDQLPTLQRILPAADSPCEPVESRFSRSTCTSARSPSITDPYSRSDLSLHSNETINLLRGTPVSKIVPSARRALVVCAAKMRLTLYCPPEYICSKCRPSSDSKQNCTECTKGFFVCFEWLSHGDCAAIVRGGDRQHIVDIDSLPEGLDVLEVFESPNWPRIIYLKRRQELIRLAFTMVEERSVDHQH